LSIPMVAHSPNSLYKPSETQANGSQAFTILKQPIAFGARIVKLSPATRA
jgi:hypothetical protein